MKILFIGPMPEPITGQSIACKILHDDLVKRNDLTVINLSRKGLNSGNTTFQRVFEVFKIFISIFRNRNRVDVTYLTVSESFVGCLKDLLILLILFPHLNKVAIHLHGGAGMLRLMQNKSLMMSAYKLMLQRIGAVIILGERHRDIYKNHVAVNKIHIVPNFAIDSLYCPKSIIDRKYGDLKKINILFLSNLLPGKGYKELISSIRELGSNIRQEYIFNIVGGFESMLDSVEFKNSIIGMEEVHYHGILTGKDKIDVFWDAHIFILPTYYPFEGQPISILEAYASGCVVVTTDHSGIFDIFNPSLNGFQVLPRSTESLTNLLHEIPKRRDELLRIATANRNMAESFYRQEIFCERVSQILDMVN